MKNKKSLVIIVILLFILYGIFFSYDTSFNYILHRADYTKAKGVITAAYSRGSYKNAKHYVNAEYEWNGEIRKLTKAKRGMLENKGKEITLYVNNSSGLAVRGLVVNFSDIVFTVFAGIIIYNNRN